MAKRKTPRDPRFQDATARCIACHKIGVDLHHLKTRKSGGSDHPKNLLPVCRRDHQLVHALGLQAFSLRYPGVAAWLDRHGWQFDHKLRMWQGPPEAQAFSIKEIKYVK